MTKTTYEFILGYLTDAQNQLIATKLHLTYQLELPECHRIVNEHEALQILQDIQTPIYQNGKAIEQFKESRDLLLQRQEP